MSEHTNERTETHACDSISRQKAINTVKKMRAVCDTDSIEDYEALLETAFEALPSAQPERKTGKWRYSRNISSISYSDMMITCDQCGYTKERSHGDVFNFCPSCGARMEGNT